MAEKNVSLEEFNTKKLLKQLEGKKALCPSCEKRLKLAGALYIYQNKNSGENLFYAICRKCEYKKERQLKEKQESIKKMIEERLIENRHPYACEVIDDPNIDKILGNVVHGDKGVQLTVFEDTLGEWHKDDEEFFDENPERRFFARPLYEGELEMVHKGDEHAMKVAEDLKIGFTIIHKVAKTQRMYDYVQNLVGHPYEEEAFVAALFMVKVNTIFSGDDIYPLYEKIKENKQIITDFKIDQFGK